MKDIMIAIIDEFKKNSFELSDDLAFKYSQDFLEKAEELDLQPEDFQKHIENFVGSLINEMMGGI